MELAVACLEHTDWRAKMEWPPQEWWAHERELAQCAEDSWNPRLNLLPRWIDSKGSIDYTSGPQPFKKEEDVVHRNWIKKLTLSGSFQPCSTCYIYYENHCSLVSENQQILKQVSLAFEKWRSRPNNILWETLCLFRQILARRKSDLLRFIADDGSCCEFRAHRGTKRKTGDNRL